MSGEGATQLKPPALTKEDVKAELARIHQTDGRRTRDTALFGAGGASTLTVSVGGSTQQFRVVPAICELDVRQALATREQNQQTNLALLVEYATELPRDVEARLAGGRVHFVNPAQRLARRFNLSGVHAEVLARRPLCQALLEGSADFKTPSGSTLDLRTAWLALLRRDADWTDDQLSRTSVLAFAVQNRSGPAFQRKASKWSGLLALWHDYLEQVAGPVARQAWELWEGDKGLNAAAVAVLMASLPEQPSDYVRVGFEFLLEKVLDEEPGKSAWMSRVEWAEAGRLLMSGSTVSARVKDQVLQRADGLVTKPELKQALADSLLLPSAFEASSQRLAKALEATLQAGDKPRVAAEALEVVLRRVSRLDQHLRAESPDGKAVIRRARMAARLLGYWLQRRALALAEPGSDLAQSPYAPMLGLAEQYAEVGGFVDFARRVARGSDRDVFGAAANRVVAAVDAMRDADDKTFASGLILMLQSGRSSSRVLPIDKALVRFGAQFLEEDPHRRLAVVLLDGMGWGNAVELLMDLESDYQTAPVRWRYNWRDGGAGPIPMLAALPTITTVSRAAFFAGKPIAVTDRLNTTDDPRRFANHVALRDFAGRHGPRLLLRSDAQTGSGELTPKARKLLQKGDRVVGLVINAIDDSLGHSPQMRLDFKVGSIKPLSDLLYEATEARRAVLLVADHGHVPTARMETYRASGSGNPRYRSLEAGESVGADEAAIEAGGKWVHRARGVDRVALLYGETQTYSAHRLGVRGTHGGMALSEVVAPAVLVAHAKLAEDPDLAEGKHAGAMVTRPLLRPRWWQLSRKAADVIAELLPPKAQQVQGTKTPETRKPKTGNLFDETPPPVVAVATTRKPERSPFVRWLVQQPALKRLLTKEQRVRLRDEVGPRLEVLVRRGGRVTAQAFAKEARVLEVMVEGVVAAMQELINLEEGYEVVSYDVDAEDVVVNLPMLKGMFGEWEL